MARNSDIRLGEHLDRFIEQQVQAGHFGSPKEVVEAALMLLEERESRRAKLLDAFEEDDRRHGSMAK
jgi:putative addiction module CopG family antidote